MSSIISFNDLLAGSCSASKQTSSSWKGKMIQVLSSTSASFAAIFHLIASCFKPAPVKQQHDYQDDDTIGSRYRVDDSRYYSYGDRDHIVPYRVANGAIIGLRRV